MVSNISANMDAVSVCHHRPCYGQVLEKLGLLEAGPGTVQEINRAVQPKLHRTGDQRWTSRTGEASSWTAPTLVLMVEVRGSADRKESCCIVTVATWEIAYTVLM